MRLFLKIFLLEPTLVFGMKYWNVDLYQNMFCKPTKVISHLSIRHHHGGCRKLNFFSSVVFNY
jgi:hypothetical protein